MKKDKKSNSAAPDEQALNSTAPKKDYQQEIDPDVKEKNKAKTAIVAIAVFSAVFFLILLIWFIKDNSVKEQKYDVNGTQAEPVIAQGEEADPDSEIKVDGSLLDLTGESVEIKIPLEYYQDKQPTDKLTEQQIKSGYVSAKIEEGSIVYTIKTSFYPSIVQNLYDYNEELFNSTYEKKNSIELVSMNKLANVFTITVQEKGFNSKGQYNMLEDIYYNAAIYQCYLGVAPQAVSVSFQYKYLREAFPFVDFQFPACLGADLSVTPTKTSVAETTTSAATQNQ